MEAQMATVFSESNFDWHEFEWSTWLWAALACAAIFIVAYAFSRNGLPIGETTVAIEPWVP
jgi:hypothetical protein